MPVVMTSPSASFASSSGTPPMSPKTRETNSSDRNGWMRSLEIIKMSVTIARTKTPIKGNPVM